MTGAGMKILLPKACLAKAVIMGKDCDWEDYRMIDINGKVP